MLYFTAEFYGPTGTKVGTVKIPVEATIERWAEFDQRVREQLIGELPKVIDSLWDNFTRGTWIQDTDD